MPSPCNSQLLPQKTSPSPNINIASAPIVAFVIIVLSAIGPHNPKANALESNKIQGDRGRMMVWAQFGKLPGHTTASQVYWPIKQMCSAVKLWKISKGEWGGISTTTIGFCLAGMFCSILHIDCLDPRHKQTLYKYMMSYQTNKLTIIFCKVQVRS